MTDQSEATTHPDRDPDAQSAATADGPAVPGRLGRWRRAGRDRLRRTRRGVVLAVVGALLLGGVGGYALGALTSADGPGRWSEHPGRLEDGPPPGPPRPPDGSSPDRPDDPGAAGSTG